MSGYCVEVSYGDLDVLQERETHIVGPFRSKAAAEKIRASIDRKLDAAMARTDPDRAANLAASAMVRPFWQPRRATEEALEYILDYIDDGEEAAL
jgi:hypothetical protein